MIREMPDKNSACFAGEEFIAGQISPPVVERLRALAAREEITTTAIPLAAFAILLHRYTRGQCEIAVEVSVAGGGSRRIAVPLRDELSLREALRGISESLADAFSGESVPCLLSDGAAMRFDWRDSAEEGGLSAAVRMDGSLVAEFTPQRLLNLSEPILQIERHWETLLTSLDARAETPISRLPILGADELDRILSAFRGPRHDPELLRDADLPGIFEAQAQAHPKRVALVCGERKMSYGELDRLANRLAHSLRRRGIGRGAFVGILLPRSMDVYLSILAVLKSGAAYVPIDPSYPPDRVAYILQDCGAAILLTDRELGGELSIGCEKLLLDRESFARESSARLDRSALVPEDPAYVIYTSGTTGRPKGVLIEHRNACNLVRAEGEVFRVRPEDRVYQGFSVAFDASVEEIWMAFSSGATLVVGTEEMVHAGPALARMLTDAGVTVLSCVPTLLSMMDEEIPTVRLLILGGEACQQDLVNRWAKPGRRLINSYGPTEATVVATCTDCAPGDLVTIGKPIPNYSAYIVDAALQPVPIGVAGELCLGGMGIARGYIGRPELTEQKFVANPFSDAAERLYRTGDLVRFTADGSIEFLGRIDEQVKLRGFRVELAEIESVLMQCPGVRSAVVSLREDLPGIQQLVGYIVPNGECFDEPAVKAVLRTRLPHYMVPSAFVRVSEFPTLASGKVDRKRLPAPVLEASEPGAAKVGGRTEFERKILPVWEELFHPQAVSVTDDFFELGGHSLLAARMVSKLRTDPAMPDVAMLDIYSQPVLENFARGIAERAERRPRELPDGGEAVETAPSGRKSFHEPAKGTFGLCALMQALGLYPLLGLLSLPWLVSYLAFNYVLSGGHSLALMVVAILGGLLGIYPAMILLSIAAKWVLIGRFQEGSYPLWGAYYWRFWLERRIRSLVPLVYLQGTPFLALYYRLLGAKIGRNVYLGTHMIACADLLTIGDDSSIGLEAQLLGYAVADGRLVVGPITIGSRCYVGAKSVLQVGATMEDDSRLGELSMVPEGARVPEREEWAGSPARLVAGVPESQQVPAGTPGAVKRGVIGLLQAVSVFLLLPMVPTLAALPGTLLMIHLVMLYGPFVSLLFGPPVAATFVALLCLEIALGKWLVIGQIEPGRYRLGTWFYFRKWFVDALMQTSLDLLHPLYATLYLQPWFRLLGAKLGSRVEISTAGHISPDLLSIGSESFIADSACLGAMRVHLGYLHIEGTEIGRRSFVGNSALVPTSAKIGDGCLIGVLSMPPCNETLSSHSESSWLGSPSVLLPRRQASASFPDTMTFRPPWYLYLVRGTIEFFRVTLPTTFLMALTVLLIYSAIGMSHHMTGFELALLFPLLYLVLTTALVFGVAAVKWAVMGAYRPCVRPLWSSFVWRTEMVTALHETFAVPFLLNILQGTPFLGLYFRLMGSKIGRRVYMESTQITEFDLARLGDDAALNHSCTIQTHLFEDRVMKTSYVRVGEKSSIGPMAVVLYDSEMGEGSSLNALSLLMKGETLPAGTRWEGVPARRGSESVGARDLLSEDDEPAVAWVPGYGQVTVDP